MPKKPCLPADDLGKITLMEMLLAALGPYAALLGVSPAELAQLEVDTIGMRYAYTLQCIAQNYAKLCTAYKNDLRDGGVENLTLPIMPPLPTPPQVMPDAGAIPRLRTLISRAKTSANYTEGIGKILGLVGAEIIVDADSFKPVLSASFSAAHPRIQWTRGQADALELWVDRGEGAGFVFITVCVEPQYVDLTPAPASAALWRYKAIFHMHDKAVGSWSDVLSLAVGP